MKLLLIALGLFSSVRSVANRKVWNLFFYERFMNVKWESPVSIYTLRYTHTFRLYARRAI